MMPRPSTSSPSMKWHPSTTSLETRCSRHWNASSRKTSDNPLSNMGAIVRHELAARMKVPIPDDFQQIFETTRVRQDTIRADPRYTDSAKAELERAAEAEARAKF